MVRFSLANALLAVAFFALVFAGFANPNEYWMQIVVTATLAVLLVATIASISWQGGGRWFWIGFAVTGWGFLALGYYGGVRAKRMLLTHFTVAQVEQMIGIHASAKAPDGAHVERHGDVVMVFTVDNRRVRMSLDEAKEQGYLKYAYTEATLPRSTHFGTIGHYAWAIVLGFFGGTLSLWLNRRSTTDTR